MSDLILILVGAGILFIFKDQLYSLYLYILKKQNNQTDDKVKQLNDEIKDLKDKIKNNNVKDMTPEEVEKYWNKK